MENVKQVASHIEDDSSSSSSRSRIATGKAAEGQQQESSTVERERACVVCSEHVRAVRQ